MSLIAIYVEKFHADHVGLCFGLNSVESVLGGAHNDLS